MAVNIQRGRDHGLPDYLTARREYGLEPVDFDNFRSVTGSEVGQEVSHTPPQEPVLFVDCLTVLSRAAPVAVVRYRLPQLKQLDIGYPSCSDYYERASAASERSLFNITGKSQYERPGPARPGPARPGQSRPDPA